MLPRRNTTKGFAGRTWRNLEAFNHAYQKGVLKDVHPVTQLVNSLLGLVVVPKERRPRYELWNRTLDKLQGDAWPEWEWKHIGPCGVKGKPQSLKHFVGHLRNATAHGRFRFEGCEDSHDLQEVVFVVEDKPQGKDKKNWRASIRCDKLLAFCLKLSEAIDQQQSQEA